MSMFDLLLSVLSLYLRPELYFPLSNNVLGRVGWPGHPLLHQHPHLKWEARDLIYFSFYFIFFLLVRQSQLPQISFRMNFLKSLFFKNDLERTNSLGLIDLPPPHLQRRNNSVKEKINSTKTKFAKIKGRYIRYITDI